DRDPFAQTDGVVEPSGANTIERLSSAPFVKRVVEPFDETLEQFSGIHRLSARPRQTRGRVPNALRRMRAIHADPRDTGRPTASKTNAFNEDPGAFRAIRHQVVRPFETNFGRAEIPCGAHQGHAGDEAELRRDRTRAWIQDEGAGVQVAPRRAPAPAPAPSARSLFLSDDPQPVGVAGQRAAARLLGGRIEDRKS